MIDNKYGCIVNVLMHIVVLSAKWQRGKNYRFFFYVYRTVHHLDS